MTIRDKNLVSGEYYHIYNRGNGKNKIFLDSEDYNRFISLLFVCNSEGKFVFRDSILKNKMTVWDFEKGNPLVSILAWTLMPNHFHIVLISHRSDLCDEKHNPITEFMRKISTAYVMYFNKKYKRTGSLFEGKFKSRHIGDENYFNYIFSYVHLNPIKLIQADWKSNGVKNMDEAIKFLESYKYSSLLDYLSLDRNQGKVIDRLYIPQHISINNTKDLIKFFKHNLEFA